MEKVKISVVLKAEKKRVELVLLFTLPLFFNLRKYFFKQLLMDKKLKILNSQQFLDKMLMGFFLNGNIFFKSCFN